MMANDAEYLITCRQLKKFMAAICDAGINQQVYILIGVGPLRSAKAAEWMRKFVPGVVIPDAIVDRLKGQPEP